MRLTFISFTMLTLALALCYAPARAESPENIEFHGARQLLNDAKYPEAIAAYQKYLADYPKGKYPCDAEYDLGCAYTEQEDYPHALSAFDSVVAQATAAEQRSLRAQACAQAGDCREHLKPPQYGVAADDYQHCIDIFTYSKDEGLYKNSANLLEQAYNGKADALARLGGHDKETLAAYKQAMLTDPKNDQAAWDLYSMASIQMRLQQTSDAIVSYQRVVDEFPTSDVITVTKMALGAIYLNRALKNKDAHARASDLYLAEPLLLAVYGDKNADSTLHHRAKLDLAKLYDAENTSESYSASQHLLNGEDDPGSAEIVLQTILQRHASVAYHNKRFAEAAKDYETMEKNHNPAVSHEACYWLGNCDFHQAEISHQLDDYRTTITVFQRYLTGMKTGDEYGTSAQFLLAYCQEHVIAPGDDAARDEALKSYAVVVNKWPHSDEAQEAQHGLLRLTASLNDEALTKILPTLPEGPAKWQGTLQLAWTDTHHNNYQPVVSAMRDLQRRLRLQIDTKEHETYFGRSEYLLGYALSQSGQTADGMAAFKIALSFLTLDNPLCPTIYYALGTYALQHDHYAEAVTDFDTVLTKYPKSDNAADSGYWKALALELQGKPKASAARSIYQQYLATNPTGQYALNAALHAGHIALVNGQYAIAGSELKKVIDSCHNVDPAKSPDLAARAKNILPEAYYDLGLTQYALGKEHYADALASYALVDPCHIEPWGSRALLEIARCGAANGDNAGAKATLKLLLQNYPKSDAALLVPALAKALNIDLSLPSIQ